MKRKKEIMIIMIVAILILFLKAINVLQPENNLGRPLVLICLIIIFSFFAIFIQNKIDKNHQNKKLNYNNIDILKYICDILIIALHLRPFQNFSNELDLAFNNIITRICVPMFFLITGYFVAKKEKDHENYIKEYIKKTIPLYLTWSALYLPVLLGTVLQNVELINSYLVNVNIPFYFLIPIIVLLIPIALVIALVYTGVYYHLWYFPALILSLVVLAKWKKKWNVKYLLVISFVLLLFGATETYYGVLPVSIKQLLSLYYHFFFTTRNFLFFGLFYVVLGYQMGKKKDLYSKYCFEKLVICIFLLVFEAILLHDTNRLNSNILLSCVPLTYYLFISVVYFSKKQDYHFPFRNLSKYYYLVHPMIIFIVASLFPTISNHPYINILMVLIITHLVSWMIIKIKKCFHFKYLTL